MTLYDMPYSAAHESTEITSRLLPIVYTSTYVHRSPHNTAGKKSEPGVEPDAQALASPYNSTSCAQNAKMGVSCSPVLAGAYNLLVVYSYATPVNNLFSLARLEFSCARQGRVCPTPCSYSTQKIGHDDLIFV